MQEKSLQVLSLVERFHDARIVDKLKGTRVLLLRSTWEMCLVAWLSRSISSAEEDVLAGTSPT
jgi:hypothetical protein